MRLRSRIAATVLAAVAIAAPVVAIATPAQAAIHPGEVCDSSVFTNGLCMNAWNGYAIGHEVNMFQSGVTNDGWKLVTARRCGGATVTHTCPFNVGSGENDKWFGHQIVQIQGGPTSLCVADANTNGSADQGHCNNSCTGSGGDSGTIFIIDGSVSGQPGNRLINLFWTNQSNQDRYAQSSNTSGGDLIVNDPGSPNETVWSFDGSAGC